MRPVARSLSRRYTPGDDLEFYKRILRLVLAEISMVLRFTYRREHWVPISHFMNRECSMGFVTFQYNIFVAVLSIVPKTNNSCYDKFKDPIHDESINTTKQMINLSEKTENYVGKLVKISHAWISKDDIHINNLDGVAYISFGFGQYLESLERHGDQFNFCHDQNRLGLRYTVDLDGAAILKECLERLESSLHRSYFKFHLLFQIEKGKPKENLAGDYYVGNLAWMKMYR